MSLHRRGLKWKVIDRCIIVCANMFADFVIFQSEWSHKQAVDRGFSKKKKYRIIINAVDPTLFYKTQRSVSSLPIQLIYTSWSSNMNKGFSYLKYLDEHLDFNKYHMKFVGNSPIHFSNIEMLTPMKSDVLAEELRKSDIFISPAKDDACSNAILEALACGLPVVALMSGGSGELIKQGGVLFDNEKELLNAIDSVANNLSSYSDAITTQTLDEIADQYISAIHATMPK
jgi:glycosyltransferase involved in cell wall biosynthesis